MTRQEQFIENCEKLLLKYKNAQFPSHDPIPSWYLNISTCSVYTPTEHQLRQLIYHEFEYDVELSFYKSGIVKVILEADGKKMQKFMNLDTDKPLSDLSRWTDGLMEVFNKLMEERK